MLRSRRSPLLIFAMALAFAVGEVGAAEDPGIACPALGAEDVAALSARLQADLAVRAEAGRVLVTCDADTAWIAFFPESGPGREEVVQLAPGETLTVELALEAVDRLFAMAPAAPPAAARAAPEGPIEPVLAPPSDAPPLEEADAIASTEDGSNTFGFGVHAGGAFEAWSSEVAGAIGPRGGVHLEAFGRLRVFLEGGVRFGIRNPEGVTARAFDVGTGADVAFLDRHFTAGIGAGLLFLRAAKQGLTARRTLAELELRVRGGLALAELQVWAGPFVALRPASAVVEYNEDEVFRVPALTFGLSADVGMRLHGD